MKAHLIDTHLVVVCSGNLSRSNIKGYVLKKNGHHVGIRVSQHVLFHLSFSKSLTFYNAFVINADTYCKLGLVVNNQMGKPN